MQSKSIICYLCGPYKARKKSSIFLSRGHAFVLRLHRTKPIMNHYTFAGHPSGCYVRLSLTPLKTMTLEYNVNPLCHPHTSVIIDAYDSCAVIFRAGKNEHDISCKISTYTHNRRFSIFHEGEWNLLNPGGPMTVANTLRKQFNRHTIQTFSGTQAWCSVTEHMNADLSVVKRLVYEKKSLGP